MGKTFEVFRVLGKFAGEELWFSIKANRKEKKYSRLVQGKKVEYHIHCSFF